jgi:hypothetical protein
MQKYDFLFSFYIFFGTKILRLYAGRRSRRERDSSGTTEARKPQVREAHAVEMKREGDGADSPTRAAEAHLWCAWRRSGSPKSLMC